MCHGQVISEAIHKARKTHVCFECGRHIKPGREYFRQNQVGGDIGGYASYTAHARCIQFVRETAGPYDDNCYLPGDQRDSLWDEAKTVGWKALRARLRAGAKEFTSKFKKRQQAQGGE